MVSVNFVADRRSCVTRLDPDRSGKTRLTSSLLNLTMRPKLRILKAVWHWVPVLVTQMGSKCGWIINSISQIVGNRVDSQDSCSARPGSTKKGCALFLVSSKLFYLLHPFEITGYPCNVIGSQWCNFFPNRTIFCSKSHLFSRPMRMAQKNKTANQISRLFS